MGVKIVMAVYCTNLNQRLPYAKKALWNLLETVDFLEHELFISDNGSNEETQIFLKHFKKEFWSNAGSNHIQISFNNKNLGTAKAINLGIQDRKKGQSVIKIDDDIVVHCNDWVEQMEEVSKIDPAYGILALKRFDLWENVNHENPFYRTTLRQLPHDSGNRWYITEEAQSCIGSCIYHSSALLDKVGYYYQPNLYGLEDTLMNKRSLVAGFKNAFLPHIPITHLETIPVKEWQKQKEEMVTKSWAEYGMLMDGYDKSPETIYYNPFE